MRVWLQEFVDRLYLKGFRHLGDERDFDHGHFLYDAKSRLVAILYHTQELAGYYPRGSGFGYLDAEGRNWIQWPDGGGIESAAHFVRRSYPVSAAWELFRRVELPNLRAHRTILDKMIAPELLAVDVSKTRQWVFTKVPCPPASGPEDPRVLRIILPTREEICLASSLD